MNRITKLFLVLLGIGADVITVTSGTVGTAGNVAGDLQTYFALKLLEVAEFTTILDQFGEKEPLPANSSKTIQFSREEKFAASTSPSQLTEGLAPDATGISLNEFQAVVEQYGFLVRISDLAILTAKHPIVEKTIKLLGINAAETYDILIFNVLNAGTTVYRPNARAADVNLLATDTIGYTDLVQNEAALNVLGGRPFADGDYVCVMAPQVHAALLRDPDFKAANQLGKPERIWKGEVQELGGVRIVRTNSPAFAAVTQTPSGATNKVYSSFMIAQFAYQITDLQHLQVIVTAPGGGFDPLKQSYKVGYKFSFKSLITNQNWLTVMKSSGQDSVNN